MISEHVAVRPARETDQARISNLIYFEPYVHRHLDWRAPLDWLGAPEYWVTEHNGRLTSVLACPPDPASIAWIRLFGRSSSVSIGQSWQPLWETACEYLSHAPEITVAAIVMQEWLKPVLEASGFQVTQRIVLLEHHLHSLPEKRDDSGLTIRAMTAQDLPEVARIDADAFAPLWQNSLTALQHAFSQAGIATVAYLNENMVGYQISTHNAYGAHLARLAVRGNHQGRGIGYVMLHDLLSRIQNMGVRRLTVNTQQDNRASLALYQRMGFVLSGEQYPVYTYHFSR